MPAMRFLFIFLAAIAIGACGEKRPDLQPAPVLYRSDQFPFEVSYDLNRWRILAPNEREIVMAQADLLLANSTATHFISIMAERSNATLAEMRTRALIALQQKGPDLKVLAQNPVTVAGAPALNIQLQATIREKPLAFSLLFLQYGGVAYTISYWSAGDTFLERTSDFEDFVHSFRPRSLRQVRPAGLIAYPSPSAGYILTLPTPEWRQSTEKLSADAEQQFQTHTALAYLMVIHERLPIALETLRQRGIGRMQQSSQGAFRPTATEDLVIDGVDAKVVFGETQVQGTKFQYAILFAVHQGHAYQMAAWAPEDLFRERYREQFMEIFRTLQFIEK
jgi:hypothetical protein